MAYANHKDITDLMPGRPEFDEESVPSADQVDGYCEDIGQELNGALKTAGYAVPVTDADAAGLMRLYTFYGVAPLVERARYPERKADEFDMANDWYKKYQDALKVIREKRFDAPGRARSGGFGSYWKSHPEDTAARERSIKRDEPF